MNDSRLIYLQGLKETVLQKGEFDMGSYAWLTKTASETFAKYPSEKKMVVIWNHGSGWKDKEKSYHSTTKGISYDDQSGNYITTEQLGKITDSLPRLDIMGFDACLMQMIEIGYEMKSKVNYIVGSEETEPGDGWDYTAMVKSLATSPTPLELGTAIVDGYSSFYEGQDTGGTTATLSLVDVKQLVSLSKMFASFYASYDKNAIFEAMKKAQSYTYSEYKDFGSFLSYMPEASVSKLSEQYKKTVAYTKNKLPDTGLSIYYTTSPSSNYFNLKFAKDTGWLK
jgi:hypothetical protein